MRKYSSLILVLIAVWIHSCKTNTGNTDLNKISGQWVLEFKRDGQIPGQYFIWKFEPIKGNAGDYEFYWKADYPEKGNFVVITGEKGSYTIENNVLYPVARTYGSQQAEPMSDIFFDSIVWYKPGNPRFELFQATDSIGFELDGDILRLKMDNNSDGDWDDEDEISKFNRLKNKKQN